MTNTIPYSPEISASTITEPTAIRYQTTLATVTPNGDGTYELKLDIQRDEPNRFTNGGFGNGFAPERSLAAVLGLANATSKEQAAAKEAFKRLTTDQVDACLPVIKSWMVNTADAKITGFGARGKSGSTD